MKKLITFIVALAMLLTVTATVYADDTFTPKTYKTAKGTAVVDGVKDEAYELSDVFTVEKGGLDRELLDGHATAKAWTLWDYDNLYVYVEVKDTTPGGVPTSIDPSWENESIEIYVDYEDNKSLMNPIAQSFEACQLRICRYPDSFPEITGVGANRAAFAEGTTYKVVDNGADGYIVEAAIKHSPTSLLGKMGFSVQINDDMNGDKVRDSVVYVDALQKDAWQYTDLLDTIEFDGFVAPVTETSSEETSSVEETASTEETSSDVVSEETSSTETNETSSTASLEIPSQAQTTTEPSLDFVMTIIVFVLAAAAIAGIIVFTTKKK